MKIKLPTILPDNSSYPFTASLLSILYPYEYTHSWIYNSFVQLLYTYNKRYILRNYLGFLDMVSMWQDYALNQYCPFIQKIKIDKGMIDYKYNNFIEFVLYCLGQGWYVQTMLNQKYIPSSQHFNKKDLSHVQFISGADEENQVVILADFFNQATYKECECSFDSVNEAYRQSIGYGMDSDKIDTLHSNYIHCYKVLPSLVNYQFDAKLLKRRLTDFIEGHDSFERVLESNCDYDCENWYGLDCYSKMIMEAEQHHIHLQSYAVIPDHKTIMGQRLDYLFKNNYLSLNVYSRLQEQNKELLHLSLTVRNLCAKIQLKEIHKYNYDKEIHKTTEILKQIQEKDFNLHNLLIASI